MLIDLTTKAYQTCSATPNTNPIPTDVNFVLLKEYAEDDEGNPILTEPNPLCDIVVNAWLEHKQGCFDLVIEDGLVTNVVLTEPIEIFVPELSREEIIEKIKRMAIEQQKLIDML